MIFFYHNGTLMSLIEIPDITSDMAEKCETATCSRFWEYDVHLNIPNSRSSKRCRGCALAIQDQYLDGVVELYPDSHEIYYGGRWFVCESLSRRTAEWMVITMGGIMLADVVPPSLQLPPAGKVLSEFGKVEIGKWKHVGTEIQEGWSLWIEDGVWYAAPTVDPDQFNGHAWENGGYEVGIRDCPCGSAMHDASSWGTVSPFGPCPVNPKKEFVRYLLGDDQDPHRAWRFAAHGCCPICGSYRRNEIECLCRFCPRCNCHFLSEIYAAGTWGGPAHQFCESQCKQYTTEENELIESYPDYRK